MGATPKTRVSEGEQVDRTRIAAVIVGTRIVGCTHRQQVSCRIECHRTPEIRIPCQRHVDVLSTAVTRAYGCHLRATGERRTKAEEPHCTEIVAVVIGTRATVTSSAHSQQGARTVERHRGAKILVDVQRHSHVVCVEGGGVAIADGAHLRTATEVAVKSKQLDGTAVVLRGVVTVIQRGTDGQPGTIKTERQSATKIRAMIVYSDWA